MNLLQVMRPRRFAGEAGRRRVLGQDAAVRLLREDRITGTSRSVLLHGPHGSGKETLGLIYANARLCLKAGDGDPCLDVETCPSCRDFADGHHSNFRRAAGDDSEEEVVRVIRSQPEADYLSDGWQVILITEAHALTAQAIELMRRRLKTADKLVFVLCTADPVGFPDALRGTGLLMVPMRPVPVPTRLSLLAETCDWLRERPDVPGSWHVEPGALEDLAEGTQPALGCALADLQSVLAADGVTLARVRALHHLDEGLPAARYLAAALSDAPFPRQLQALTEWAGPPAERIAAVEALLAAIFQADVEHVVPEPSLLTGVPEVERTGIFQGMADRAGAIGLAPRRLWSHAMATWRPDPWARDATLTARAAEFRDLLDESRGPPTRRVPDEPAPRRRASRSSAQERFARTDVRLRSDQVADLWDAAAFAVQMRGCYLNASIHLDHDALGQASERQAQNLVTNLLNELGKRGETRRRRDPTRGFHWLYVHERDDADRLLTRIVLHVPSTMRDVEPWLSTRFMPRHGGRPPAEHAVTVRLAREDGRDPLPRHRMLLRLLCRGIDPAPRVVVDGPGGEREVALARVLGVPAVLRRSVGALSEIRRFETSRWIAHDARSSAAKHLPVLSAFAEQAWQASVRGYDRAEHEARAVVLAALEQVDAEFPPDSDLQWRAKREARRGKIVAGYVKAARGRMRLLLDHNPHR